MTDEYRADNSFITVVDCDLHRKEMNTKLDSIIAEQKTLNDRLYKDNGKRSIQSILNDHERILRVMIWIACAVGVAAISNCVLVVRELLVRHFGG